MDYTDIETFGLTFGEEGLTFGDERLTFGALSKDLWEAMKGISNIAADESGGSNSSTDSSSEVSSVQNETGSFNTIVDMSGS
jgi:hypothetical protein